MDGDSGRFGTNKEREASARTSLTIRFRRTPRSGGKSISERPAGSGYSGFVAAAGISVTRFFGGVNLFPRPYVRFRQFHLVFGASNLTFVSLL
jgi:hypothetical protein